MKGDGDFRSKEVTHLRDEADIIVTNPPFSLFREFFAWIIDTGKKFLLISNKNCITYKEVFPFIKAGKMWTGKTSMSQDLLFKIPSELQEQFLAAGKEGSKYRIVNGEILGRSPSVWFTNIDHGRLHQSLELMTMADNLKYSKHKDLREKHAYERYDNYNAIEIPYTDAIPSDYLDVMGVPISFLDKYCIEQFEILNANDFRRDNTVPVKPHGLIKDKEGAIGGKPTYARILIRKKQ